MDVGYESTLNKWDPYPMIARRSPCDFQGELTGRRVAKNSPNKARQPLNRFSTARLAETSNQVHLRVHAQFSGGMYLFTYVPVTGSTFVRIGL